jgi:metallo-beta-lactamase family protein
MIPSFALERTQDLLFELHQMHQQNTIPSVPMFMDSPLAIKMTEVYKKHMHTHWGHLTEFNPEIAKLSEDGEDIFQFAGLKLTPDVDQSKAINNVPPPKVIIAGSGMSQGGRIMHHEARYLSDPNSTILFVGYQVDGSLGRRIQRGEKQVRIFGQTVNVNCHVETISSYSAHADQPALLAWVKHASLDGHLQKVFVVQGEEAVAKTLANLIRDQLSVPAYAPKPGEMFEI